MTANGEIELLSDPSDPDGAALTFRRVIEGIRGASDSIVIHMFVWRSDAIGNEIGRAVLDAADRGVTIHIKKDTDAFMFERIEMNRKSLFNKPIPVPTRLLYRVRALSFPDTWVEDQFGHEQGDQLTAHDNISIEWVHHTHSKYYIFDQQIMITGSINIEDRHRGYWDYMVQLGGADLIERFNNRNTGRVAYDPDRSIDFVLNNVIDGRKCFEIKPAMLDAMDRARRSVYIEMAYIGDPQISRKIIEIARRGVAVTILFSKEANIGNDINYRSLCRICKRADLTVYLSEKMIHSKLILVDDEIVILGSANISVFSMQKGVELDVIVKDQPRFVESVKATIDQRIGESAKAQSIAELSHYNRVIASLQQLHQLLH